MASKGREDLLFQVGYLFETQQRFLLPKQGD
jgi:amidase